MIELSSPPDRNEPTSTSATIHFATASSSTSRSSCTVASRSIPSSASAAPCGTRYHRRIPSRLSNSDPGGMASMDSRPMPSNAFSSEANASPPSPTRAR